MVLPDKFFSQKFVQFFMWKKICQYEDVCKMFLICQQEEEEDSPPSPAVVTQEMITTAINEINSEVFEPIHMKITKGYEEKTGDTFYALVNIAPTRFSKFQFRYSKNETEYFKKLVEAILTSGEGEIDTTTALNLVKELEFRITMKDLEQFIQKFCSDMWLIEEHGILTLSTRARLEFASYLRGSEDKDYLDFCTLCKEVVLQYYAICKNCDTKIHKHCKAKYFRNLQSKNCPVCKNYWDDE